MSIVRNFLKSSKLFVLESTYTRKMRINLERPVFSFTFDDAPLSSALAGRRILESAGATGTYYLALGIQPVGSDRESFVSHDIVRSLYSGGHDIQCHTYSHLNVRRSALRETVADCERNRRAIIEITGQDEVSHFAYPFGMVGLGAKKELGKAYKTLRTVDFGINSGMTDITHLRSIEIFSSRLDRNKISRAIEAAVQKNAWIIFFTHDVKEDPSPWGSTFADLKWVVDQCMGTACDILSVKNAYEVIEEKCRRGKCIA